MVDSLAQDIGDSCEQHLALTKRLRRHYHPDVPYTIELDDRLLPDLLAEAVQRWGGQVAVDFFGATMTFERLQKEVLQAAAYLKSLGVGRGDVVALVLPNCPQFLIAFYAAAHLGAIAAAHNPLAPPAQLNAQIAHHGARVVLVWEGVYEHVSPRTEAGVELTKLAVSLVAEMPWKLRLALRLPLAKARATRAKLRGDGPFDATYFESAYRREAPLTDGPVRVDRNDPVALLHTGGTTGTPKAAILTHLNLMSNVEVAARWVVNLEPGKEVFYEALPFFHAFGLTLTMNAIVRMGAVGVMFPTFDESLLCQAMRRRPATFFLGVPPMFERFAKAARRQGVDLSTIRYSISGAMPLSREIAQLWEDTTGGYLVEGYGMTETSPIILGSPFSPKRRTGTLGLPFPSIGVRIVDPDNPTVDVPDGEVGELITKGPHCSPGYWNDSEQTAALYTDEGWLRTGDLVRNDDDFLVMTDRHKEVIISNGFNIYPSEVESAVRKVPGVKDCAAVGLPDPRQGEKVVVAIVVEPNYAVTLEQVREVAAADLARYALPRQIVIVSDLPRSQIGKVVRRQVRERLLNPRAK